MDKRRAWIVVGCLGLAACGESQAEVAPGGGGVETAAACEVGGSGVTLPDEVSESSGLARSRRDANLFWTHNDAGNEPEIFAIGPDGQVRARVEVAGADLEDWEDIEAGPCTSGACLYIGDIGDNEGEREEVVIYRVPEPSSSDDSTAPAAAIRARFEDGPQDSEALFVLPDGDAYIVTKGREGPIRLYRLDDAANSEGSATLAFVAELFPEPEDQDDRVTGAGATPNGEWVAIRTYRNLYLYSAAALTSGSAASPPAVDLSPLGESQGESVAIADDGSVWMTSEAESDGDAPLLSTVRCTLGG